MEIKANSLTYWHIAWLELVTLDRLCHQYLGLMQKYFLNGYIYLQRLALSHWLSHLLNMRHKLYQPEKPTSNINVVNSKIPKDQGVKSKLGLFDLHIWKRRTIALAEQDDDSYLWHRNKFMETTFKKKVLSSQESRSI